MTREKNILFERKLIIPLGIITAILLIVLGFVADKILDDMDRKIQNELQTSAVRTTIQFETWYDERLSKFTVFVGNLMKNQGVTRGQVENAMQLAKQSVGQEKAMADLHVAYDDDQGFFSLFGLQTGEGYIASELPWYTAATAAGDKIAQTVYYDMNMSRSVVSLSKRIVVDGVEGVIAIDYNLDELFEKFDVLDSSYHFIVNRANEIIYHPDAAFKPQNSVPYSIETDAMHQFGELYKAIFEKDYHLIKGGTFLKPEYMRYENVEGLDWVLVTVFDGLEWQVFVIVFSAIAILLLIAAFFGGAQLSKRISNGKAVAVSRLIMQKGLIKSLVIAMMLTALLAVIAYFYVDTIESINKAELSKNTEELAIKSAELVRKQIENDFKTIVATATMIGGYPSMDGEKAMAILKEEVAVNKFKRMALIDLNGNAITTDNLSDNFSGRDYFLLALAGNTNISDTIVDLFDQKLINVYATPVYTNGKMKGVLIATSGNEEFTELLSVPTFQGMGYSYVVKSTGERIVGSNHITSMHSFDNIFDVINEKSAPKADIDAMKAAMLKGDGGILHYELFNEDKYLNYEPIGISDWYIFSIMSEAILTEKSNTIINISLMGSSAIVVLFGIIMLYIVLSQNSVKRKLSNLAYVDTVTGYGNMNMFLKEAGTALGMQTNKVHAMVAMDIDKFKTINDVLGRKSGDEILKHCATVIHKKLTDGEYACRINSDHFCLLLSYTNPQEIIDRINDISDCVRNYAKGVNMLLSFGIYEITEPGESIESMYDYANIAKKTIKGKHDTYFAFYSSDVHREMLAEKEIENNMYQALENEEFVMFLQPKYNMEYNIIVGAEALVRWVKPANGIIPPDSFIPLFERNGFIIKLDYYIWEQVIMNINRWIMCGRKPVPISINVSRRHFVNFDFIDVLQELLDRYQVDKKYIEVELTESAFIDKDIAIYDVAKKLSEQGFHKSIDDFGTGYSSLNLLRKIDVEVIKIDKEFLDDADDEVKCRVVLSNVVSMIKQLNMSVVVEGVETSEHVRFLTEINCDVAQGYFYAKPMSLADFEKLLFG